MVAFYLDPGALILAKGVIAMQRTTWFILALVLSLFLSFGCDSEKKSRDATEQLVLQDWTNTFQDWRSDPSPLDYPSYASDASWELSRFRIEQENFQFTLDQVGVTEEELNQFQRRVDLVLFKGRWLNLFAFQSSSLWEEGSKHSLERKTDQLLKQMIELKVSPEDLDLDQMAPVEFAREHHSRQAAFAMRELYRFPTQPRVWDDPSPSDLVSRVTWELEMVDGPLVVTGIFIETPITVEHAEELATLAYKRMLLDLLQRLRNKEWSYPMSSDKVDEFYLIYAVSEISSTELDTSNAELEDLRLRIP